MQTNPVRLIEYFDGNKQNVIPRFQRPYSWNSDKLKTLWEDLLSLYSEDPTSSHFMGVVVSVPATTVPVGVNKHLVIDGQQRLITISILLTALRERVDERSQARIQDYLVNRHFEGADHLKLFPTYGDCDFYSNLVLEKKRPPATHLMRKAYDFFVGSLDSEDPNGQPIEALRILNIVEQKLRVVMINLDDADDPYLIFESLNYKGEPLTQADLVRNYVMMRFKHSLGTTGDQERIYFRHWRPIEQNLGDDITDFLRNYCRKDGENVLKRGVYAAIKQRVMALQSPAEVELELAKMAQYADLYAMFLDRSQIPNPAIRSQLETYATLKVSTCFPLLLRLFNAKDQTLISEPELIDAMSLIESFIIRRSICGLPNNALDQVFLEACKNFQTADVCLWLGNFLASQIGRMRWPPDAELEVAMITQPQYSRISTKYILSALEIKFGHKEPVDLSTLTIEHVLPQEITDQWREMLGQDWEQVHNKWLHTIGNLTLTGYNSELGNMSFSDKREYFKTSNLEQI